MMGSTPPRRRLTLYGLRERREDASWSRTKCATAEGERSMPLRREYSWAFAWMYSAKLTRREALAREAR